MMMRACKIDGERSSGRVVVSVRGPLTAGSGIGALLLRVRQLVERGARQVILDLSGVPFVDCAGIGVLVRCLEEARRRGSELRVRHCTGPLRRMLSLSALLEPLQGGTDASAPREEIRGQDVPPLLPS
jgi:anti-anti-sigma factor